MIGRLLLPHTFRVAGVVFLAAMALGRLPAMFALPAGLGDIATGIAAALVASLLPGYRSAERAVGERLRHDRSRRRPDPRHPHRIPTDQHHPSSELIGDLPLALIPTAAVPLLLALHITSLSTLLKTRPAAAFRRADDPTAQATRAGSATSFT